MTDTTTIGIAGGTGPAGRGLALRLAAAGDRVLLGSRSAERAGEVAAELTGAWPDHDLDITGVANEEAVEADLVVLAAPWEGVLTIAATLGDALVGKTVISIANALSRIAGNFLPLTLPHGSVTAEVEALLPRSRVVGAFHHVPAGPLGDLDRELGCDVLVCADDLGARAEVMDLVERIPGLRPIDAGGLDSAGAIESITAVLVQVNVNYRTHSMLRLEGDFSRRGPARRYAAGD